jgi:hypothetical protein
LQMTPLMLSSYTAVRLMNKQEGSKSLACW